MGFKVNTCKYICILNPWSQKTDPRSQIPNPKIQKPPKPNATSNLAEMAFAIPQFLSRTMRTQVPSTDNKDRQSYPHLPQEGWRELEHQSPCAHRCRTEADTRESPGFLPKVGIYRASDARSRSFHRRFRRRLRWTHMTKYKETNKCRAPVGQASKPVGHSSQLESPGRNALAYT